MTPKKIAIAIAAVVALTLTGCATPEADVSDNTFDQIGEYVGEVTDIVTGQ